MLQNSTFVLCSYILFAVSLVATLGSLFFSEVMELTPCVLCWYQRIAMYPLVVVFTVGMFLKDPRAMIYALPLVVAGIVVSVYHNLLYYKLIPQNLSPCVKGISCTDRHIEWLGFITIPLMSFLAFSIIFFLSVVILQKEFKPRKVC
jgi:disulfide bond formation protein DsbB